MTVWTAADWDALAPIVFASDYPGNATARGIVEAPAGDGRRDTGKRYSHIADKYLDQFHEGSREQNDLFDALANGYDAAVEIADQLGVHPHFWPSFSAGALRLVEYAPGIGSHTHTDADLFTVNLWRNVPNAGLGGAPYHVGELGALAHPTMGPPDLHHVDPLPVVQRSIVYFAIPDHATALPGGVSVGEWLRERMKHMRYQETR